MATETKANLTVLTDNSARDRGLLAEHGLSIWLESAGARILFDTGQGLALRSNAEKLNVNLRRTDAVVLSHGHYDHTGGLAPAGECFIQAQLFVHPSALERKYAGSSAQTVRAVGSVMTSLDELRPSVKGITLTDRPTEVAAGVWVTGEIPRRNEFEDTGGPFFLDEGRTIPDPLTDDQALFLETTAGIAVLLGCGHAGLVNTLDYVADLTGQRRIFAVLGGLHLLNASEERVERSIDALRRYQVRRIGPAHCTGLAATARLLGAFPSEFVEVNAGTRLTLG